MTWRFVVPIDHRYGWKKSCAFSCELPFEPSLSLPLLLPAPMLLPPPLLLLPPPPPPPLAAAATVAAG